MPLRVNSEWGRGLQINPSLPTPSEFEMQAKRLGLTPDEYVKSNQLRVWCKQNRNRCYVPEGLLKEWQIPVDPNMA